MNERWWPGLSSQLAMVAETKHRHEVRRADGERLLPYWAVGQGSTPRAARLIANFLGLVLGLIVFVAAGVASEPFVGVIATVLIAGVVADGWYFVGARLWRRERAVDGR